MKKQRRLVYCICKAPRVWASESEKIKRLIWESEEKNINKLFAGLRSCIVKFLHFFQVFNWHIMQLGILMTVAGLQNAMFDELAERSLMSPLAGMKHTYARLATWLCIKVFRIVKNCDRGLEAATQGLIRTFQPANNIKLCNSSKVENHTGHCTEVHIIQFKVSISQLYIKSIEEWRKRKGGGSYWGLVHRHWRWGWLLHALIWTESSYTRDFLYFCQW